MKKLIVLLFLSFPFVSHGQAGDQAALLKAAQDYIQIFSISMSSLERFTNMQSPVVDIVERDMAICMLIGARSETLIPARDAMYELRKSFPADSDKARGLLDHYNEIGDAGRMMKSFCYRDKKEKFKDLEYLKRSVEFLKEKITSYQNFLRI
jgi:hypothetical protein